MAATGAKHSIAVVHLIRKLNGIAPFKAFLSSYLRHTETLPHDLVLIFKDFNVGEDQPYLDILENTSFVRYDYEGDGGLDLAPYIGVSRELDYEYFCFLNSFSKIESDNWLTYLHAGFQTIEDAGVIGATGSWESSSETDPPFPNPHIRTNGFMISADLIRKMDFIPIKTKEDARVVESGENSLTQQTVLNGKKAYLVDTNGEYWPEEKWAEAGVFRSGEQSGLIISDNRTRAYMDGDAWMREYLHAMAWTGKPSKANPFKRHKLRHRLRRLWETGFTRSS